MKLLVVGASRGVGRQVVEQALASGHEVTALARQPERLEVRHEHLKKVRGDVMNPDTLESAVAGQDAVCEAIGVTTPWEQPRMFSTGTERLIEAMKRHGVQRLVCVTGIGAGDSKGHGGFFYDRVLFPLLLAGVYADKDVQEARVRASNLDWTIVRPGFLTNGPLTRNYRVCTALEGVTAGRISRADVAHFIVQALESNRYLRQTPLLTAH